MQRLKNVMYAIFNSKRAKSSVVSDLLDPDVSVLLSDFILQRLEIGFAEGPGLNSRGSMSNRQSGIKKHKDNI